MPQFTVSVNVVVSCSIPDVAVTVTVDVTGCVPPPPPPPPPDPELPPPPHPFTIPTPARPTASTTSIGKLLRFRHPSQQNAAAKPITGTPGISRRCKLALFNAAVNITVVNVVTGGVTVVGKKLHVTPAGNPEQPNETAESNPPTVAIETVAGTLDPEFT
jgi:hypothetical protein